jgi:hypothetical protein
MKRKHVDDIETRVKEEEDEGPARPTGRVFIDLTIDDDDDDADDEGERARGLELRTRERLESESEESSLEELSSLAKFPGFA